MVVLIGSAAMNHWEPSWRPNPRDIDIVGDYDQCIQFMKDNGCKTIVPISGKKTVGKSPNIIVEAEIAWRNSSTADDILKIAVEENWWNFEKRMFIAPPEFLYTLKMSHRYLKNSPHFLKTRQDIMKLREMGIHEIPDRYREFFKKREKETYTYSHPKLNQKKNEFFDKSVKYVYDHDSIHEAVKLNREPAYTYFKDPDSDVYCSKSLFEACAHWIKLCAVYEESCVLAIERSQVPYPETDPKKSFEMALTKVCTSITSGWFRDFAWENYDMVFAMYDVCVQDNNHYLDLFRKGLASGVVKPHMDNAA